MPKEHAQTNAATKIAKRMECARLAGAFVEDERAGTAPVQLRICVDFNRDPGRECVGQGQARFWGIIRGNPKRAAQENQAATSFAISDLRFESPIPA
jgi:hypothetical protein